MKIYNTLKKDILSPRKNNLKPKFTTYVPIRVNNLEFKLVSNFSWKILLLVTFCLLLQKNAYAQTVPNGERLKDIAGNQTLIGSVIGAGTYLPINTQQEWKQNSQTVLLRECSAGTVLCFPTFTWTGPYQYDLDDFNATVNWLEDNNKVQIAHLLAGGFTYHPQWLIDNRGTYSQAELRNMLEQFIKTVIQSNNNDEKVDIWNVVNEAFFVTGDFTIANSVFNALGREDDESGLTGDDKVVNRFPIYIRLAFEYARKYTNKKLELRENNCHFSGLKHDKLLYQLANHLKNKNVPVDVISFQTHLSTGRNYDWNDFKNQIKKYKDLGYEVYITELDVGNSGTSTGDQEQRDVAYNAIKAAREAGVGLINFWGLRDGELGAYREDEFPNYFETANFNPKPSYYGMQQALNETKFNQSPQPPINVTASTSSNSQIQLSWGDASYNEAGFKIERKTGNGSYSQIASVGSNRTSYTDNGLAASTTYSYRIRAYNTYGNSTYSNQASATTSSDTGGSSSFSFIPVADSYIDNTNPSRNNGSRSSIAMQSSSNRQLQALTRFQVNGLVNKKVIAAKLVLKESPNGSINNNNSRITVRRINSSWSETAVSWNNRPVFGTQELGSYPRNSIQDNETIEINIDAAFFDNDGVYNLALLGDGGGNDVHFYSREGSVPPKLVLTLQDDAQTGNTQNIIVRVKGDCGGESMSLQIGGSDVKTWNSIGTAFANFQYTGNDSGAIRVRFINDGNQNQCDKNIQIDYISINGNVYQAEGQEINTGVYQNGSCGGAYSQSLHCGGYIQFNDLNRTNSIEESLKNTEQIRIYPNPVTGNSIQIEFLDSNIPHRVSLYDVQGKMIQNMNPKNNNSIVIDASKLATGMYILKIIGNKEIYTEQIIKK
ncbi:endo-1,4-beta-xylanase [uncultured Aquimarina sp.]|uniref:endo-1,4-beta-xylanase n=1 Tax=uncultured Aquimarina sp. TaxID=575652 RepID=UPI00262EBB54|nr:endo-1,4-beta-xylanase [uncultured Aquimarina sp.]